MGEIANGTNRTRRKSRAPSQFAGEHLVFREFRRRGFDAQLGPRKHEMLVGTRDSLPTRLQVKTAHMTPWYVRRASFVGRLASQVTVLVLLELNKARNPLNSSWSKTRTSQSIFASPRIGKMFAKSSRKGYGYIDFKSVEKYEDSWGIFTYEERECSTERRCNHDEVVICGRAWRGIALTGSFGASAQEGLGLFATERDCSADIQSLCAGIEPGRRTHSRLFAVACRGRRTLRGLFDNSVEGHLDRPAMRGGHSGNSAPTPHISNIGDCMRPHLGQASDTCAGRRWRSWPLPPPIGIEASSVRKRCQG